MLNRLRGWLAACIVFLIVSFPLRTHPAPAPHSSGPPAARTPDLSGVWIGDPNTIAFTVKEPPLKPWARAKLDAAKPGYGPRATSDSEDPILRCTPPGVPRIMIMPFPMQIIQAAGQIVMVFEYDHYVREIEMDRHQHPKDLIPTWMGDSIGRWDGNTLVVDTVGLNDKTWLDQVGHPHSSSLHVVERIRRIDHDTLEDKVTIDDPGAYASSWSGQQTYRLRPGWKIKEYVCEDTMPESLR